ncbi:hypothetical protein F5B19DRAFT_54983 [Rostrohypoxylon terebratum]|nr:hypothetical protein F5B19DRAFT_54983 [Rostrohypoxylon terebratum]
MPPRALSQLSPETKKPIHTSLSRAKARGRERKKTKKDDPVSPRKKTPPKPVCLTDAIVPFTPQYFAEIIKKRRNWGGCARLRSSRLPDTVVGGGGEKTMVVRPSLFSFLFLLTVFLQSLVWRSEKKMRVQGMRDVRINRREEKVVHWKTSCAL